MARTQCEWFCVTVENRLKRWLDFFLLKCHSKAELYYHLCLCFISLNINQNILQEHCGLPLGGGVGRVERVLELDDLSVALSELALVLHVVLDELGQRGKLLPAVQVIVVARVLDLDVRHFPVTSAREKEVHYKSISLSSSKSYTRAEIGYVTEVNFVRK